MEKIQLTRSIDVEDLTEEEYYAAKAAVNALRYGKKPRTDLLQMSETDAASAKSSGRVHGDPFFVVNE